MESPENIETAEKIILRWDSTASEDARDRLIFSGDRDEIRRYLQAVDEIQRLSLDGGGGDNLSSAVQIAMARLEDEFRGILLHQSSLPEPHNLLSATSSICRTDSAATDDTYADDNYTDDDATRDLGESSSRCGCRINSLSKYRSSNSIREVDLVPAEAVADLRSIVERMVAAGYLRECVQVYGSVRKSALDSSCHCLGIEKLSIGDIQRLEWELLESKIRQWIKAVKVCVRILFASEKSLCGQIFKTFGGDLDDACFMEAVKIPAIHLFNFAEAVSISRRSPEKLFKILDLHDTLEDLMPDIGVVFDSKLSESVRVQAAEILSRLAEAARGILSEFENKVLREPSMVPVPGGTIHPLTRYVMNYINLISDYKQTMTELISSKPSTGSRYSGDDMTPDLDLDELEGKAPLSLHLIWIIVILQFNLEGKSRHYKDASLAHLFLMNNVHYIVQKIKGSPELREMIGDDYLRKLTGTYRRAATGYQRSTWVRVLYCLRDEGLHVSGGFSSGVSRSVLRERFKAFNTMFDEVHRVQTTWIVPDNQLREELRIAVSELLIPAYRSFLGRYKGRIESGRHPEQYIKYSVEDLENMALDFFEGYQGSQHSRRRSQS